MADPICRWRNPYLATVTELIEILPKEEHTQQRAREIVDARSPYEFYRTPYQLACQLGLYHETNGRYFPKFTVIPTQEEVAEYLENWIVHYCVPNPYTRGFDNLEPFSIHAAVCRELLQLRSPIQWDIVRNKIFGNEIGNNDILVNSINSYSPIISIHNGTVSLKHNKNYEDLQQFIDVDISTDRTNKEYFFDLFQVRTDIINNPRQPVIQELLSEVNLQDLQLINEVQILPYLTQTEKNQIVAARIGQGFFRRKLILECGYCPITLVDDSALLVASHIKPWRVSDNTDRINPKNGLLLTPTFDKLFDKGMITFSNDKRLVVSNIISEVNKQRLNLVNQIYPMLPVNGREEFLEFHRDVIFKG